MGYKGKLSTNKIPRKKTSLKNVFTKKVPKIVSMGDRGKLIKNKTKKHEKNLYEKSSSEKKFPKYRINGVQRKAIKKTWRNKFLHEKNHFHKNLSQRSYQ